VPREGVVKSFFRENISLRQTKFHKYPIRSSDSPERQPVKTLSLFSSLFYMVFQYFDSGNLPEIIKVEKTVHYIARINYKINLNLLKEVVRIIY
jgi:serine/threonine protein kinase